MGNDSMRRITRLNFILGGALTISAAITQPRDIALGVLVGVILTCANFIVLSALVRKWTAEAAAGAMRSGALVMPKMLGLMVAVVCALEFLPIDAAAFAVGYSTFVVSIMVEALYSAFSHKDDASNGASSNG